MNGDGDSGDRRDDPLLRQLGRRAREQRAQEKLEARETWAATGSASARAQSEGTSGAGPAASMEDLFAPWDQAAQQQLVAALQGKIGASPVVTPAPKLTAVTPTSRSPAPLSRLASRWRAATIATLGVLAAAGVALWVGGRASSPLPTYALLLQGGDQVVRSGSEPTAERAAVPVLQPDSLLELQARPASAVAGVQAAGFARVPGAPQALPLGQPPEISSEGAVRWRGSARQLLGGARGEIEVVLVVGAGPLPTLVDVLSHPPGRHGTWQSLVARVRVSADP